MGKTLAASLGIDAEINLAALCANKDVLAAVLKEVKETCAAAKLSKFEIPAKVILVEELWTPENDMLTAVQKLKRREIVAKHKAAIDSVYIWAEQPRAMWSLCWLWVRHVGLVTWLVTCESTRV